MIVFFCLHFVCINDIDLLAAIKSTLFSIPVNTFLNYFFTPWRLMNDQTSEKLYYDERSLFQPGHFIPKFTTVNWAVCVPAACSAEDARIVVEEALNDYNSTVGITFMVDVNPNMCYVKQKSRSYSKETIGVLYVFMFTIKWRILCIYVKFKRYTNVQNAYNIKKLPKYTRYTYCGWNKSPLNFHFSNWVHRNVNLHKNPQYIYNYRIKSI